MTGFSVSSGKVSMASTRALTSSRTLLSSAPLISSTMTGAGSFAAPRSVILLDPVDALDLLLDPDADALLDLLRSGAEVLDGDADHFDVDVGEGLLRELDDAQ